MGRRLRLDIIGLLVHKSVQKIVLTGDRNVVEAISTKVNSGMWHIKFKERCYKNYQLNVEVHIPSLTNATVSGSGDINIMDFIDQEALDLRISGSGDIYLNKFQVTNSINTVISGSGSVYAKDSLQFPTGSISIPGSGFYDTYKWKVEDYSVNISGSGNCYLTADSTLNVDISGSGVVHYKGHPQITKHITGSGTIIDEN